MFYDGDSVLPTLMKQSAETGAPQVWGMSAVLFVPELLLHNVLWSFALGPQTTLAAAGVVGLVLIYVALRLVARVAVPRGQYRKQIAIGMTGFVVFCAWAATETSSDRNVLELASLQSTLTYYSATVVAVVIAAGISVSVLAKSGPARTRVAELAALSGIVAFSVFSNPIFMLWFFPAIFTVIAASLILRSGPWWSACTLAIVILASAGAGWLARTPLSDYIIGTPMAKVRPDLMDYSLTYYLELVAARVGTPLGLIEVLTVAGAVGASAIVGAKSLSEGDRSGLLLSVFSVSGPLAVTAIAILCGTDSARYLQPWTYSGAIAVCQLAASWKPKPLAADRVKTIRTVAVIGGSSLLLITIGLTPTTVRTIKTPPQSLQCAAEWINSRDQVGAGTFWTSRPIKTLLENPRQLVQTDAALNRYGWLANWSETDIAEVSYIVVGPGDELPDLGQPQSVIQCDDIQVLDFSPGSVSLGPAHG